MRAIRFLIENPRTEGAFNLCAPQPLRNAELSRVIGKVLRRPSFIPVPAFAMKLLLGEKSIIVLDGQRQLPKRLLELGFTFRFPTVEAALRDLMQ